ncbi:hypothetical protein LAZ67_6003930 [Cordylochernes scorpioides]|uniref:Uncharacterized protein n=1 Tax=Cordylochernes scorpioides TaxID=51811 RepID=A0ABY6KNY0_9ARAC|nr:hypothetical protein LAZ67_6003930 [Cordylochernes scorpioides]
MDNTKDEASWMSPQRKATAEEVDKITQYNTTHLCYIITGVGTWIHQFDPKTKRPSSVWVFENEVLPTKVKWLWSVGKRILATFSLKVVILLQ